MSPKMHLFSKVLCLASLSISLRGVSGSLVQKRGCTFDWYASQGDTCATLASQWDITEKEFISFNPGVNCNNLVVGNHYCVEWTGELPPQPSTTQPPSSSTSKAPTYAPPSSTTQGGPSAPGPTQSGIISSCVRWHLAKSTTTCSGIIDWYGTLTLAEFYKWNPAVKSDCSGLWNGYYYCIGIPGTPTAKPTTSSAPVPTGPAKPSPTQAGLIASCERFHKVKSTTTCASIIDWYGTLTLAQFYKWNPAVGNNCQNLWLDYYVCIGIPGTPTAKPTTVKPSTTLKPTTTVKPGPSPTQANVTKSCKKWAQVKSTTTCQGIADYNKIKLSDFYKWNPDVNSACTNLWLGYYVCAGV